MGILYQNRRLIIVILFLLLIAAIFLLFDLNKYPLVDYDEATYAQVTVHTLESGDLLSLQRLGQPWFEKPPLYFWLAMTSIKVFGQKEFAFRLPAALMSLLILLLTYLIVWKLTKNYFVSSLALLILLFTPPFFYFGREVRLDSGAIAFMLLAVYFFILSFDKTKWLLFILPAVAVSFMFKSVVAFLAIPIIIIYSLIYKKWFWLKNKFFYFGLILGLTILLPWHIIQYQRYGQEFLNNYFFYHVIGRAVSGIGTTNFSYFSYFFQLYDYCQPWFFVYSAAIALVLYSLIRNKTVQINILAPLASALFIIILFSFARTHIFTYLLPAYPFLAMFVAQSTELFLEKYKFSQWLVSFVFLFLFLFGYLIGIGRVGNFLGTVITPIDYTQRDAAKAYFAEKQKKPASLYLLNWPTHETIRYYGDAQVINIPFPAKEEVILTPPFYLWVGNLYLQYFFDKDGNVLPAYQDIVVKYYTKDLFLFYSEKALRLPQER